VSAVCYAPSAILRVLVLVIVARRLIVWPEKTTIPSCFEVGDRHIVETGLPGLGFPVVQVDAINAATGCELSPKCIGVVDESRAARQLQVPVVEIVPESGNIWDARRGSGYGEG
jgi:hypothetical protein